MAFKTNGSGGKLAEIQAIIHAVLDVDAKPAENYDRLAIRTDDRVQSRIDKNNAPGFMVERYAHQMGEYVFPPIIVTSDDIIIDGNTRAKAHAQRNERYISVLVVPVSWDDADAETRRKLLYVSELINNMNGLPLGDEERRKMVVTMIESDLADEEIVTKVGMSQKQIAEIRDEYRARTRLVQIGVDPQKAGMTDRTLRAFGKTKVMKLDDESFRDIAALTIDAGLKANEIKSLATSLADAGSAELRHERIERERKAREEQIAARRQGNASVSLTRQLRQHINFLLGHPLAAFVEHNSELIDEHVELIQRARDVLEEIQELHESSLPASGTIGDEATASLS